MDALDVTRIRQDFPVLQRSVHGKPLVYLDNAATSQKPRAMIETMAELYSHDYAKVEEGHTLSREATRRFEGTRELLARLINAAEPREVVFCRGATEALNLVAHAFLQDGLGAGDEVLITQAEHHSNIIPWLLACRKTGATLRAAPVTPAGELDLEAFERMLDDRVRVVSVTHASNVTGAVFPVKRITELAHARGIPVVVDGAQSTPHVRVDVRDIGCELFVGSGHKMGGPSGVGFLYGAVRWLERMPVAEGGASMAEHASFDGFTPKQLPFKHEAGEPAFGEVVAWGTSLEYWDRTGLDRITAYEKELTAHAAQRLASVRGVRVLGSPAERLAIVTFVVDGKEPSEVEKALDAEGIAVRAGNLDAEPLLEALGARQAVRASFLFYNTRAEADALADAVERIAGA